MAKELGPFFGYTENPFYWVGDPLSGDYTFSEKRKDMIIIGGITDDEASYSYDDWAIVYLDGAFYLFSTSGCSCPSPSETWRVECGPSTIREIREKISRGDYDGYTVPGKQMQEFMEVLDYAESDECSVQLGFSFERN